MAEEKGNVFDDFRKLNEEISNDINEINRDPDISSTDDKDSSEQDDTNTSSSNDEQTPSQPNDNGTGNTTQPDGKDADNTPQPEKQGEQNTFIPDGESHAYADINLQQMGKPKQKGSNEQSSPKGDWPKAPERKKPGKGGGGKDIMEVIWNEFIMGFYDWVIDTSTNLVLDFTDWVLYKRYERKKNDPKKPEEPKTVFDIGDDLVGKYSQNAQKGKDLFDSAHNEIVENISKSQAGMAPEWKIWKKEPKFFNKILDLAEKAQKNPNSPEAAQYARFTDAPKIMENTLNIEVLLRKMSVGIATIEAAFNEKENSLSPKARSILIKMKKSMEKETSPEKLKEALKEHISKIEPELNHGKTLETVAKEKIENIKGIILGPEVDMQKLQETIGKNLDEMKQENLLQVNIENNSKGYYEDLMSNIAKIYKTYAKDSEKRQSVTHDYLSSIAEAIKTAKNDTDSYLSSGMITSKNHEQKAQRSMIRAAASINEFMLNGQRIGKEPKVPTQSPLTGDKYKILNMVREYSGLGA